jgi:hypothetical protein
MKLFLQMVRRITSYQPGTALKCAILVVLTLNGPGAGWAAEAAKTFGTPEEAFASLAAAVKAQDGTALRSIFGSAIADIENPDRVQATNEFTAFAAALATSHKLVHESATRYVLEMGTNGWEFPVPLVQQDGRWFFDTAAGTEELLNRRIGKNELTVLEVVRAYVDAQREYASGDHTGNGVLKYAQRLASTPGTRDGLYWPESLDGEVSPLGLLVAEAQGGGYELQSKTSTSERTPLHGYYFKILTRQGKHPPGGKYDYIINGNMIGGFALVAWPADYGHSGIMTFIVNQQGRVYQKDLGEKTEKLASRMTTYDPDKTWVVSPD